MNNEKRKRNNEKQKTKNEKHKTKNENKKQTCHNFWTWVRKLILDSAKRLQICLDV